jgi:hypothetical protein
LRAAISATTLPDVNHPVGIAELRSVALLSLLLAGCPAAAPSTTTAAAARPTATQKGVALGLFAADPAWDYGPLLDELQGAGATDVLVAVVWAQPRIDSARIHRSRAPTTTSPDDATVVRTLLHVRDRGMRATLFPIERLELHTREEWRGRIAARAGVDAWFDSYRDFVVVMAGLAAEGGAARFSVGSELLSVEHEEARWRALIKEVRRRFSGRLLYSANWDHYRQVPFWDAVDEVGVTAYFELAGDDDDEVSDDELQAAWAAPKRELLAFAASRRQPLVITEVGYPAKETAAWHPWDETARAAVDVELQARLYDAFCAAWKREPLDGFYVWNWFGFGGDDDGGYTPRGKPAARALARCLRDPAWDSLTSPDEAATRP